MASLHVRIGVRGTLVDEVRDELPGFVDGPLADGRLLLWGTVPDQAALLSVLERLHVAGLVIEDVEQLLHPEVDDGAVMARIQVAGRVADYLARNLTSAVLAEQVATTIEVKVTGQDAFFALLSRLEALAIEVREVHVRRCPPVRMESALV